MSNKVGLFKRLLVNFYDLILLFAVLYFFTIPIILLSKGNAVLDNIFYQTYLIAIIFLYYAWFWKRYNQTLGMKIWKIKIYSRYSLKITYLQSIKRILIAIPVLFAVASITFFLIKIAPGGPFDADRAVSPQVLKNLNEAYNLDASNWEQYLDYMGGLLQGDLGPSFRFPGRSVTEMIATGLPVTFELAFYAILIALLMGIFSGGLAAFK